MTNQNFHFLDKDFDILSIVIQSDTNTFPYLSIRGIKTNEKKFLENLSMILTTIVKAIIFKIILFLDIN